jgi:hypothetical protein
VKSNLYYCRYSLSPLRKDPEDFAEMISQVQFGEVVELILEQNNWFKIRQLKDNYEGWLDRKSMAPLTKKEAFKWMDISSPTLLLTSSITSDFGHMYLPKGSFLPFDLDQVDFKIGALNYRIENRSNSTVLTISEIAESYIGSPYLWGGKSPFGIDCSGLTQMVFRFVDINLPRDAFQQFENGQCIDFEDRESGDLVFFINALNRIHHVGIYVGKNEIIHAHGCVRKDSLTQKGIVSNETGNLTHEIHQIKRL